MLRKIANRMAAPRMVEPNADGDSRQRATLTLTQALLGRILVALGFSRLRIALAGIRTGFLIVEFRGEKRLDPRFHSGGKVVIERSLEKLRRDRHLPICVITPTRALFRRRSGAG
jgi:hypothetical protein